MTTLSPITPAIGKPNRHRWADPVRFPHKTERTCTLCGIAKVTRHEPGEYPWLEFYRGLERIACEATPRCEGVPQSTSANEAALR